MSQAVINYDRATPVVATGGLLQEGAVTELVARGFAAVLDLRTAQEGTAEEQVAVEAAGLSYFNIPIAQGAPSEAQVRAFAAIVENAANHPILVHCASGNRVGAMWTHYRVAQGMPFEYAVEQGRTAGLMPARENAVRARLGEPPLAR
jgi:uncharacterized protein (TIGR01244 family)